MISALEVIEVISALEVIPVISVLEVIRVMELLVAALLLEVFERFELSAESAVSAVLVNVLELLAKRIVYPSLCLLFFLINWMPFEG